MPDDSTLLAVVRKPADSSAVAASLNRDLDSIQECRNHWCVILKPNKTKALVIIIIILTNWSPQFKARREREHYQSEDPNPTKQLMEGRKR